MQQSKFCAYIFFAYYIAVFVSMSGSVLYVIFNLVLNNMLYVKYI